MQCVCAPRRQVTLRSHSSARPISQHCSPTRKHQPSAWSRRFRRTFLDALTAAGGALGTSAPSAGTDLCVTHAPTPGRIGVAPSSHTSRTLARLTRTIRPAVPRGPSTPFQPLRWDSSRSRASDSGQRAGGVPSSAVASKPKDAAMSISTRRRPQRCSHAAGLRRCPSRAREDPRSSLKIGRADNLATFARTM